MQTTEKIKYRIKEWDDITNTFVGEVLAGCFAGLSISIRSFNEGEEEGTLDVNYDVLTRPTEINTVSDENNISVSIDESIINDILHSIINDALEFVYRETQEKIEVNVENTSEHRADNTKQSDNE